MPKARAASTTLPSHFEVNQSMINSMATTINAKPKSRWSNTSFAVRDALDPIWAPTNAPADRIAACK